MLALLAACSNGPSSAEQEACARFADASGPLERFHKASREFSQVLGDEDLPEGVDVKGSARALTTAFKEWKEARDRLSRAANDSGDAALAEAGRRAGRADSLNDVERAEDALADGRRKCGELGAESEPAASSESDV